MLLYHNTIHNVIMQSVEPLTRSVLSSFIIHDHLVENLLHCKGSSMSAQVGLTTVKASKAGSIPWPHQSIWPEESFNLGTASARGP